MEKVILILDNIKSCSECPLFGDHYNDMCCKGLNNRTIDYPYPDTFRQKWCPLKSLPEPYNIEDEKKKPHDRDYTWEFEGGYNACLNEILEKGEN